MREIKFRAWCLDHKCMDDDFYIRSSGVVYESANRTYDTPNIEIEENPNLIVMQFTGLQDKNGVDIYEGDVVKKESNICEVIFSKKAAKFCVRLPSHQWHGVVKKVYSISGVEVIGNIYQNPELINNNV